MLRNQKNKTNTRVRSKVRNKVRFIDLQGFRSIKNISNLEFSDVNVLVGANGAGKSNFLSFFDMLGWMIRSKALQEYIAIKGGGDDLLFNGAKHTRSIRSKLTFESTDGKNNEYQFTLQHTEDNSLVFTQEKYRSSPPNRSRDWRGLGVGHRESKINDKEKQKTAPVIKKILKNCTIYQFHDTSAESPLKLKWDVKDNVFLRSDGGNLAPVLFDLKENHSKKYDRIVEIIRQVLPLFSDFNIEPIYGKVALGWRPVNNGKFFGSHLTSDGTLRLMALTTLLNMPLDRISDVVLIDEPELGLHPYAISLLVDMIKILSHDKQIFVATQSPLILNAFEPKDIIVTEMDQQGATSFRRLKNEELQEWLKEFEMGELWQKNVIGGNP